MNQPKNVKNCTELPKSWVLRPYNCANEPFLNTNYATEGVPFLWICASKGMDLGPNLMLGVGRVGFGKFCATKRRGFALASHQGYV